MKSCIVTLTTLMLFSLLSAQDYFPLAVGNQWTKKVINPSTGDSIGYQISTIIKDTSVGATQIYIISDSGYVQGMGSINEMTYYSSNGNDVLMHNPVSSSGGKRAEHSITDGDSWTNGRIFTYHTAGSKTVPFGTFASCFVMTVSTGSDSTYYAPNVGIIKTVFSPELAIVLTNYVSGNASIKQKDLHGGNSGLNFNVVANPANLSVNILCNSNSLRDGVLSIYNLAGKMMKQYRGLNQRHMTVDVSELSVGTYYLKLQVTNNVVSRKVTIIR